MTVKAQLDSLADLLKLWFREQRVMALTTARRQFLPAPNELGDPPVAADRLLACLALDFLVRELALFADEKAKLVQLCQQAAQSGDEAVAQATWVTRWHFFDKRHAALKKYREALQMEFPAQRRTVLEKLRGNMATHTTDAPTMIRLEFGRDDSIDIFKLTNPLSRQLIAGATGFIREQQALTHRYLENVHRDVEKKLDRKCLPPPDVEFLVDNPASQFHEDGFYDKLQTINQVIRGGEMNAGQAGLPSFIAGPIEAQKSASRVREKFFDHNRPYISAWYRKWSNDFSQVTKLQLERSERYFLGLVDDILQCHQLRLDLLQRKDHLLSAKAPVRLNIPAICQSYSAEVLRQELAALKSVGEAVERLRNACATETKGNPR